MVSYMIVEKIERQFAVCKLSKDWYTTNMEKALEETRTIWVPEWKFPLGKPKMNGVYKALHDAKSGGIVWIRDDEEATQNYKALIRRKKEVQQV